MESVGLALKAPAAPEIVELIVRSDASAITGYTGALVLVKTSTPFL
jgi:hypothetical protein